LSTLVVLIIILFIACSPGSDKSHSSGNMSDILHPSENSYLNLDEYETVLTIPEKIDTSVETKFTGARRIMIEGKFFGDEKAFGMVKDMEVDKDGNLFVLETEMNEIRMFDKEGNFVQKFGGAGKGPGEYRQPEAIELIENRDELLLLVADGYYKVDIYDVYKSELVETLALDYSPMAICYTNNTLFIHGYVNQEKNVKTIHKYNKKGEVFTYVSSFADIYPSGSFWVSRRLGEVRLSCNDNGTVTTVNKKFPLIQHYDAETDKLLWKKYIEGQRLMTATERKLSGRIGLVYNTNDSKVDIISSIVDEDSSLYLQSLVSR